MSWLSRVADAMEREPDVEVTVNPFDKIVASREKTIRQIEAELVAYDAQASKIEPGKPARVALEALCRVKRQRLEKCRVELAGFRELLKDPRQFDLGEAVRKPGK